MPIQRKESTSYQVTSGKEQVTIQYTSLTESSSTIEKWCKKLGYIIFFLVIVSTFAYCFDLFGGEPPQVQQEIPVNQRPQFSTVKEIVSEGLVAQSSQISTAKEVVSEDIYTKEEEVPTNYTLRLISRSQWTSYPGIQLKPLTVQPARYVVVCHTAGSSCNKTETCTNIVKNIETWHRQIGLSTAWYNFMIGGDGHIYEGRGWDKEGGHSPGFNCASIGVAFLGNFEIIQLTPAMMEAYSVLIEEGIRRGALVKDYKMVGHFQVKSTASPGRNIRELISTWPHWDHLEKEDYCT